MKNHCRPVFLENLKQQLGISNVSKYRDVLCAASKSVEVHIEIKKATFRIIKKEKG